MKQLLTLLAFLLFATESHGQQDDLDTKMQKMASQLAERIRAAGKNRVGIADFNDLQGNVPELGKYLAVSLQGELVNNQLRIINRDRIEQLLTEKQLTAQNLLDPANSLAFGKAAGMEIIVTGTITPVDDRTIALNVLALDIQGAIAVASAKTTFARTNSTNDLLRSTVKKGGGNGAVQETPSLPTQNLANQDIGYILLGDKSLDLPKTSCLKNIYNYGQICLENISSRPLVLYQINGPNSYSPNILFGKNARNCTGLIYTGSSSKIENASYELYFHTTEDEEGERRYGKMAFVVEGCKVKTSVINADRLFLSKTKP